MSEKHPLRVREEAKNTVIHEMHDNLSVFSIKIMLVAVGITLIVLAIYINNPLVLAGIVAWIVLP